MKKKNIRFDIYDIIIFIFLSLVLYFFINTNYSIYQRVKTSGLGVNSYIDDMQYVNNNLELYINIVNRIEEKHKVFDYYNEAEEELVKSLIKNHRSKISKHEESINDEISKMKLIQKQKLHNQIRNYNPQKVLILNYQVIEDLIALSNESEKLGSGQYIDVDKLKEYKLVHEQFLSGSGKVLERYIYKNNIKSYNDINKHISLLPESNTKKVLLNHYNKVYVQIQASEEIVTIIMLNVFFSFMAIILCMYSILSVDKYRFFYGALSIIIILLISLLVVKLISYSLLLI